EWHGDAPLTAQDPDLVAQDVIGEAPGGAAEHTPGEPEGADNLVGDLRPGEARRREALRFGDRPEPVVEQVEPVAAEVEKQPVTRDLRIPAPAGVVSASRALPAQVEAHHPRCADTAVGQAGAHELEVRQRSTVVSDEQWYSGSFTGLDHRFALGVGARHRLLDVDGLA